MFDKPRTPGAVHHRRPGGVWRWPTEPPTISLREAARYGQHRRDNNQNASLNSGSKPVSLSNGQSLSIQVTQIIWLANAPAEVAASASASVTTAAEAGPNRGKYAYPASAAANQ